MRKNERIVYVDLVDFTHEIGEGNAPGPHYIYNTLEEIKTKQPCVEECGIIKARLVNVETVQPSNYSNIENRKHRLSFSEKYALMKKALNEISNSVEYTYTQKKIAEDVLLKVEDD